MGILYSPRTWVAGEVVTALQMNTEVRDASLGLQAAWTNDGRASTVIWTGTGTSPAIGNGTIVAKSMQVGKTYDWEVRITMGSTTTFGSAGWILTPPVAPLASQLVNAYVRGYDASLSTTLGWQLGVDLVAGAFVISAPPTTQPNSDRLVTSAIPFAWTTSDVLALNVRFETA